MILYFQEITKIILRKAKDLIMIIPADPGLAYAEENVVYMVVAGFMAPF